VSYYLTRVKESRLNPRQPNPTILKENIRILQNLQAAGALSQEQSILLNEALEAASAAHSAVPEDDLSLRGAWEGWRQAGGGGMGGMTSAGGEGRRERTSGGVSGAGAPRPPHASGGGPRGVLCPRDAQRAPPAAAAAV